MGTLLLLLAPTTSTQGNDGLFNGPIVATTALSDEGIWLIDLGSGTRRYLSFGRGTHLIADFSPDGCQFLFLWERNPDNYDLYAANLDGSNLRQLVELGPTGAVNYRVWEPAWSPDGSRILFTLIRYYDPPEEDPYRLTHIAWVPPTGGQPVFYSNDGHEWQPRWSPDGAYIAYVSEQPLPDSGDDGPRYPEIWVTDAAGVFKQRVTSYADAAAFNPRWSPDGQHLAFIYQPYSNSHRLMITRRDGSSTVALHQSLVTILDYAWHPAGQHLTVAMQGFQNIAQNTLWNLSIGGSSPVQAIGDERFIDYPRWSPDGRWLAFRRAYELGVYDSQQGTIQRFGETASHNNPPVWSPIGFSGEANCEL